MKNKISLLVVLGLVVGLFAPAVFATKPTLTHDYIEIIFDGSGSMKEVMNGEVKIDIARNAIDETLGRVDAGSNVGLRVYGLEKDNCESSELLVDFALGNHGSIVNEVNNVEPTGPTPIGYSVALAREDLEHKSGARKIIVIGDGQETCGADLEMEGMRLKGLDMDLDAIFLGDNMKDAEDLKALADAAGGSFYSASSSQGLKDALNNALGNFPTDFDLPDPPPGGGMGEFGVEIAEEDLGQKLEEMFEENCKIPYKLGDQVLYEEYDLEEVQEVSTETSGLEVILDVSGSMAGRVGGKPKLDVAREALGTALDGLTGGADIAFRVYGHRIDKTDKANSCKDIELLMPFSGSVDTVSRVGELKSKAANLSPRGWTPISDSLVMAADDLKDFDNKVVLLLSDGEETCGGDPVSEMKALQDQGVQITVHTVGFDVDAATAQQLRDIAAATGGTYVDAGSATELTDGLSYIVDEATKEVNDCPTLFQNPVKGGPSLEEAAPIEPGAYTFDKFLEKGEYYFFKFPVKSGQLVTVHGLAARPAANGNPEDGYTEQYGIISNFDIEIFDPNPNKRKNVKIGMHGAIPHKAASIAVLEDGEITLKIGNGIDDVHRDNIFSFDIEDHFDLGTGEDVSDDEPAVLGAVSDDGLIGGLGLQDETDTFVIPKTAKSVEVLTVAFDNPDFKGRIEVYDENDKLKDSMTEIAELTTNKPVEPGDKIVIKDRNIGSDGYYSGYRLKLGTSAAGVLGDVKNGGSDDEGTAEGDDAAAVSADDTSTDGSRDASRSEGKSDMWKIILGVVGVLLIFGGGSVLLRRGE